MNNTKSIASNLKTTTDLFLKLSSSMLLYDNQDDYFTENLSEVGSVINVHRTYVFRLVGGSFENAFSWVDPSLPAFVNLLDENGEGAEKALLDDGLLERLRAGKPYVLGSLDRFSEGAQNIFKSQRIIDLIIVPLFSEGNLTAFFGVDLCEKTENWAKDTVSLIETIGYLLNNAIHYFNSIHSLQKKEEEAQSLLDVLPFPIFITDPKTNNFLCYNKTLADLAVHEDISTSTCHKIMYDFDEPCPFCKTNFLETEWKPVIWDSYNAKYQTDFKVINSCVPWEDIDNARLTIALDISDSLRMQRDQVLERESNVAKGRFLANMSHELRTPLNGIIGMTHLAIQSNKEYKVGTYLQRIQASSKNLLHVINDILDFSKIEAGKLELEQHAFSPLEIFTTVKDKTIEDARLKNIVLKYSIDKNVPKMLMGDDLRITQVVLQLVKNAIKFTEEGTISYSLALHEKRDDCEVLCLKVEDTGIGISEDNLQSLFVGFSQADTSHTRRYGGTGIGLSIVDGILKLMGGTIEVQSIVGKGTTFMCYVPFVVAHDKPTPVLKDLKNVHINDVRVLLAEDNEINSLIVYEMLTQRGCLVDCVQDGQEVLDALAEKNYDIVLMDVQMPFMSGIEATKIIRQDAKYDSLPIVALTAHILTEEIEKCYKVGMQGHVHKPISLEVLCHAIYKYTKESFHFKH